MFTTGSIGTEEHEDFYKQLIEQARHLIMGESNEVANLSNVSALLKMNLQDTNWVGFYLWNEQEQQLILGPFQGKPACIRIDYGRGVCGTAVSERQIQVVADVHAFPGHIACDPDSRSEIVIPFEKAGRLIGVLDIDSPSKGRFSEEDAKGLREVMDVLIAGTSFPLR
ncbi:MAG: hypothetical protein A2201_05050 [Alicyclobacillus sp. RIFOXYA1_FULL_53_8]|nr:MAG: hypothetical protein A2201_05050 [Alicyclobacillus sp. RIFOXYA1_FULL_53_8]